MPGLFGVIPLLALRFGVAFTAGMKKHCPELISHFFSFPFLC